MSNKAFSLVSGSCKLATRCSIFNAWLFDEDVLLELLVCCCCAACAAIIIACTNRPIDWKRFDALCAKCFSNTSRTNIDRIRAEFSSKHKRLSLLSHYTKEYKSSSLSSFSSVAVVVVVAESCSSLFHLRCRDHLWGNVERIFLKRKERCALCCVVSVVVSQTVAAFDTKNKEERKRERVLQRALLYLRLSRVFAGASFCFREEYSIGAFDSSREADARRACWNAEKRIRFLCADDDEDAIFGTIHPRSGNFDDDFDE